MTHCQKFWKIVSSGLMGSLVMCVSFALAMPAGGTRWGNVGLPLTPEIVLVDDDQQHNERFNERGPQRGKKGKRGKRHGKGQKEQTRDHENMSPEMQSLLKRQQQEREELRVRHKEELNTLKSQRQESRKGRDDRREIDRDDDKRSHDGEENFKKEKKAKRHKGKGRKGKRQRQYQDQTREAAPLDSDPGLQEVVPPGPEQQNP